MRVLVVSPIASHPQNQGNSARVYGMCKALQALGHLIHFLYYPLEGLTPEQRAIMTACWDAFHSMPLRPRAGGPQSEDGYGIDDWYHPDLGVFACQLHEQWRFDAVLVNYVWMSGLLEALPADLPKIIDTHDVFGNRDISFRDIGMRPEWYYTSPTEERRGLCRADIVIAIQAVEADYFRQLLGGHVKEIATIGYGLPIRFTASRQDPQRPIVGYIGSGNPFNTASIRRFELELARLPELSRYFRFVLAGTICDAFPAPPVGFDMIGRVSDLEDFYASVDLAINPMIGGTGLKIKTLEALSFGLPLLGTADAWTGIAEAEQLPPEFSSTSIIDGLCAIMAEPRLLGQLRDHCRSIFLTYQRTEMASIQRLCGATSNALIRAITPASTRS